MIALAGSVDVTVASQLLDAARQAAAGADDILIDAEHVERFDLSAVQILLALRRAMAPGRRFWIGAMSDKGRHFLELSGVAPELMAEAAPASSSGDGAAERQSADLDEAPEPAPNDAPDNHPSDEAPEIDV